MTDPTDIGVLVVDDEREVTALYERWLSAYRTAVVNRGDDALDVLSRRSAEFDVVLLDRKMPGMNGRDVLDEIRDREYDCRVAMITAVNPDYDIVEMAFDDYVTKPVDGDTLRETVETLRDRADYADGMTRYFSLAARRASLLAERPKPELRESDEFAALEDEIAALQSELDETVDLSDHEEFQHALREL